MFTRSRAPSPALSDAPTEVDETDVGENEENKAFSQLFFPQSAPLAGLLSAPNTTGVFHHFSFSKPAPPARLSPPHHPSPHPTSSAPQPLSVVTGNADNTIAKREERKRQNRLRRKALSQQRREIRKDVEKRKVEQRQERRSGPRVIIAGCFVNSHITINNNLVVHL